MEEQLAKTAENKDWVKLLKAVELINSPKVRDFTKKFLEEEVPDYFARIPASATGKYHPEHSLGYGGLVRHTLMAAALNYEFSPLDYLQMNSYERDLMFASLLLHDTFKQGETESGNTLRNHASVAAKHIAAFGKGTEYEEISSIIAKLVVSHMGQWGNNKPGNRGQFLVHLADFLSSRRYMEFDVDSWLDEEFKKKYGDKS